MTKKKPYKSNRDKPIKNTIGNKEEFSQVELKTGFYHPKLFGPGHSPETKVATVAAYLQTGDMNIVGGIVGIPASMVGTWKRTAEWWEPCIHFLRESKGIEYDHKLTCLMDRGMEILEDRMKDGDHVLDPKTGNTHRVPLKAREVSTIMSQLQDHQSIIRGEKGVVSTKETVGITEMLSEIASNFREIAKEQENRRKVKTIEGTRVN